MTADPIDLAAMFLGHVEADPGRDAIVTEQAVIAYAELGERVLAAAEAFAAEGVVAGETVGVAVGDEIGHIVTALALICLGAPQVTLPAHQTAANKGALARLTGATRIVADTEGGWAAEAGIRTLRSEARRGGHGRTPALAPFAADGPVLYRTTSGTTGTPKAFGQTATFVASSVERIASDPWHRRLLRTSTMEFDSTKITHLTNILAGNTSTLLADLQPSRLIRFCHAAGVTDVHMGAQRLQLLTEAGQGRLPPTTRLLSGGSRVPGGLRAAAARTLTDELWISYATSEVGIVSFATPDQHAAYPEGVGIPLPGVTVEIRDADGAAVAPGEIGLARIAKPGLPRSYLAGPDQGPNLDSGWFYSNDLMSQPEGGPLIFHERADDLMVLSGLKIFPAPIEDALTAHPDVAEAVAYPLPSRVHGDIPVAAVVLRPDAAASDSDLLRHCRAALGVNGPRRVFIVDAIPRTMTGKPVKRLLPTG